MLYYKEALAGFIMCPAFLHKTLFTPHQRQAMRLVLTHFSEGLLVYSRQGGRLV